jgi:hypothetical protein
MMRRAASSRKQTHHHKQRRSPAPTTDRERVTTSRHLTIRHVRLHTDQSSWPKGRHDLPTVLRRSACDQAVTSFSSLTHVLCHTFGKPRARELSLSPPGLDVTPQVLAVPSESAVYTLVTCPCINTRVSQVTETLLSDVSPGLLVARSGRPRTDRSHGVRPRGEARTRWAGVACDGCLTRRVPARGGAHHWRDPGGIGRNPSSGHRGVQGGSGAQTWAAPIPEEAGRRCGVIVRRCTAPPRIRDH